MEKTEREGMKHGGNVWDEAQPGDWLDYSANLRPEGMPEWVVETMHRAVANARYYPDRQMRAARAGLAAALGVEEARVLPTAGGAQAIDLALSLSCGRVLVHAPTFGEYAERARARGRSVAEAGNAQPGDTRVLCNPNNPTGEVVKPERVLEEFCVLKEKGASLLVDEAFIDYCPAYSVRRLVQPGLTVVGSLTKILCVPGVRLGYVCAAPEEIRALEERMLTWSLNVFASAIAAELPLHAREIEEDAWATDARREAFARSLERLGARVMPSHAPFLLADFGCDMTRAVQELKRRRILVRTCESFGLPPTYLRLAVKTDSENARFLEELRECIDYGG